MLPKPIARPFDMARDRARLFVEVKDSLKSHPVIGTHIKEVLGGINTHSPRFPLPVEAAILSARGAFGEAILIWEKAYNEDPTNESIAHHYADALADAGEYEKLSKLVAVAPMEVYNRTYFLLRVGLNQEVIDLATETLAEPVGFEKWVAV